MATTSIPLSVRARCPHTIVGSRQKVLQHLKEHGYALWLRACGRKATLFYMDDGKRRQKTWRKIKVVFDR